MFPDFHLRVAAIKCWFSIVTFTIGKVVIVSYEQQTNNGLVHNLMLIKSKENDKISMPQFFVYTSTHVNIYLYKFS